MMMSLPSGMNGFSASQGYGFGVPRKAAAMPAKPTEQAEDKEAVALQQAAVQHRTNATLAGLATVVAVPTVGLGVSEFAYRNGLKDKLKYAGPVTIDRNTVLDIEDEVRAKHPDMLKNIQSAELQAPAVIQKQELLLQQAKQLANLSSATTVKHALVHHQSLPEAVKPDDKSGTLKVLSDDDVKAIQKQQQQLTTEIVAQKKQVQEATLNYQNAQTQKMAELLDKIPVAEVPNHHGAIHETNFYHHQANAFEVALSQMPETDDFEKIVKTFKQHGDREVGDI